MVDLKNYKKNFYSQGGEDGIIKKILEEAEITEGYFIEFGAWDGIYLSNTCYLAENGWEGVFIEGHPERYNDLLKNYNENPNIECIKAMVMSSGENSLSNIIDRTSQRKINPVVLSVDIDSNDLAAWKGFDKYRSFLVVIEYNPTIPADVSFENPEGRIVGNSALAIYEYAKSINYVLVMQTSTNMIFVDSALLPKTIKELDFFDTQKINADRFFFGYDGTLYRQVRNGTNTEIREDEVFQVPWANTLAAQPIPHYLRLRWRNSRILYFIKLVWSAILLILTRPLTVIFKLFKKPKKFQLYLRNILGKSTHAKTFND